MNRIIKLTVVAAALFGLAPIASAPVGAVETSGEMFDCMHEGTKVRKTYIRHTDPVMLEEAVRIFDGNVAGRSIRLAQSFNSCRTKPWLSIRSPPTRIQMDENS